MPDLPSSHQVASMTSLKMTSGHQIHASKSMFNFFKCDKGKRYRVHRNMALLVILQMVMSLYVAWPFYISPYLYKVNYEDAENHTLHLANASFKQHYVPWMSAPSLPRVLTRKEHDSCIEFMRVVDELFNKFDVPYVLAYGNLVGSFTMHDLLPWDDDIDLLVSWKEYDKFQQLLARGLRPNGLSAQVHDTARVHTMKIYFQNGTKAGLRSWTWPFVDIAFYEENNTHVWNQNVYGAGDMMVPRSWFFPITRRPFASLWLPAPRNTGLFLQQRYGKLKCIKYAWNHKDELPWWSISYAPCEALKPYYPFVWRTPVEGGVKETLKLGNNELYSVVVHESFSGDVQPFVY